MINWNLSSTWLISCSRQASSRSITEKKTEWKQYLWAQSCCFFHVSSSVSKRQRRRRTSWLWMCYSADPSVCLADWLAGWLRNTTNNNVTLLRTGEEGEEEEKKMNLKLANYLLDPATATATPACFPLHSLHSQFLIYFNACLRQSNSICLSAITHNIDTIIRNNPKQASELTAWLVSFVTS